MAYHFHWSRNDILQMEHGERLQWIREIERLVG
ncbi:DUF6760 family protein [Acaryochloris marina]|nr:DUF6760 family protein [Acaryochloris marina]